MDWVGIWARLFLDKGLGWTNFQLNCYWAVVTFIIYYHYKKKKLEALAHEPARIHARLVCLDYSPIGLAHLDPFFNGLPFLMSNLLQIYRSTRLIHRSLVYLTLLIFFFFFNWTIEFLELLQLNLLLLISNSSEMLISNSWEMLIVNFLDNCIMNSLSVQLLFELRAVFVTSFYCRCPVAFESMIHILIDILPFCLWLLEGDHYIKQPSTEDG